MDASTLIIVGTLSIILYIVGEKLYRLYKFSQQLNKIPGPKTTIPFIGIPWEIIQLAKEDRLEWGEKLSLQYPSGILRLWVGTMGIVGIRKPEQIEVILRSNVQIMKSIVYDYLKPWLGHGLLTSTGAQWFHSRKLITPAFHFGVLENFTDVIIEKANIFNKCLNHEIKIHGDKAFDIFELTGRCALDIICETAMGVNIHAQEQIENDYSTAVNTISAVAISRFIRPWLMWDSIFYKTSSGKAYSAAIEKSHSFCTRVIEKKQRERKSACIENDSLKLKTEADEKSGGMKKAFLDVLLEANEKEENPLTIEEIRDQANTFMFAGHDTTGALIAWALFCLGNELDVQKKVHEELDEVLGDSDDQATLKRLSSLKYLERVIKEVLRLYPSAAEVSRKLTDDIQIDGYIIPKGTIVSIGIFMLHRDASIWPDPLRFEPDRFLPENSKIRHPYSYIPFSAGPRNCIGQKFAMLETKIVLAQVLRNFIIKSVESHTTVKKYSEIILRPLNGIYVHMKRR